MYSEASLLFRFDVLILHLQQDFINDVLNPVDKVENLISEFRKEQKQSQYTSSFFQNYTTLTEKLRLLDKDLDMIVINKKYSVYRINYYV